MNPQAPFDLSPLASMMLVAVLLAALPLAWVAWRKRGGTHIGRVHALTLLTLFLTFDLVLFGAFTRLSDSGLGCPDWPGCYGNASPSGAAASIASAETAMPSGPVTQRKAWVEMIHRYLATGVGVLIMLLAASSWLAPRRPIAERLNAPRPRSLASQAGHGLYSSRWWATATLVWVCVQGAFGALTVTMKLFPAIVTLHLLGGLLLLVLLTVQVLRQGLAAAPALIEPVKPSIKIFIWLAFAALVLQIALGGWVSTNYAVLACNEFPRCQGAWWPLMDFDQGFQIWRQLGLTQHGDHIGFAALTAIHYTHRIMAGVVMLMLGALAWRLNAIDGLRPQSRWLAALLGLQLATGLSNVVLDWPLLAALMHTGGAAALILVMTWLAFICGQAPAFSPQRNTAPGARLTELRPKA